MYTWSYGLAEFLRHSNEDKVCGFFVGKLISLAVRRIWPDCTKFIRIADIGCGSGSKAVEISRYLRHEGIKTDWELIDIDDHWKNPIRDNIQNVGSTNDTRFETYCPMTAESWSQSLTEAPHVAQFLH